MKNLVIVMFLLFSYLLGIAQKTTNMELPKNEVYTIKKDNGFTIVASDVFTNNYSFQRKIEIFNASSSATETVLISFTADDPNVNIYSVFKDAKEKISGRLTFEHEKAIILDKHFVNGQLQKQDAGFTGLITKPPFYNPNVPCTFTTVHDCVAYNIDEMSWISYILCLASAPACYAEQWADCAWQVCKKHMQYTNPN